MTGKSSRDTFALLRNMVARYHSSRITTSPSLPELIDLSIGNPDMIPEMRWRERLQFYISQDTLHGYGEFRTDINNHLLARFAAYYERRFLPVNSQPLLNPSEQVIDLLGSKEGIFYSLFACLKAGDAVLMPNPSYTIYQSCARLIGARVELFPCDEAGQPDLSSITGEQLLRARLLVICSPGNPTGVSITNNSIREILEFAERHDLWVVVDRAYAEIDFLSLGNKKLSGAFLHLPGALSRVIELHSLSKSCNLAGWRMGFAVGAAPLIKKIREIKRNSDFGTFLPFQCVAAEMLDEIEEISERNCRIYEERMHRFVDGAAAMGWHIPPSVGTFFLWAPLPPAFYKQDDLEFAEFLLQSSGVLVAPGSGFGADGAGMVRIALVHNESIIDEALERMNQVMRCKMVREIQSKGPLSLP